MVKMPALSSPTVDAIYAAYEADRKTGFRPHLGASLLGDECKRKLWLTFRWALNTETTLSGRQLRLFESGDLAEARFVKNLRRIGATVHDTDPDTGRQWRVSAVGGHSGGSLDAIVVGLPEAPKTWHVAEFKTHNDSSFKKLAKGVSEAKPLHFAQMQIYMQLKGLERAIYLASNKNTDELYAERVYHDEKIAERLLTKAANVIAATIPPDKIDTRPDSMACRWCDFKGLCHLGESSQERNCRTCAHSSPITDREGGVWFCTHHERELSEAEQRAGCPTHVFIPQLVAGEPVAATAKSVTYKLADGTIWKDGVHD